MGEEEERGSDDVMEELLERQTLTCHIHVHRCTHTVYYIYTNTTCRTDQPRTCVYL